MESIVKYLLTLLVLLLSSFNLSLAEDSSAQHFLESIDVTPPQGVSVTAAITQEKGILLEGKSPSNQILASFLKALRDSEQVRIATLKETKRIQPGEYLFVMTVEVSQKKGSLEQSQSPVITSKPQRQRRGRK